MAVRVFDDRRRELLFIRPPRRIVSLVPSDTLNVQALGGTLVGRTRYCDTSKSIPSIGGTKDVDVDAVARLEPDLILANQEENSRKHLEEMAQLGLPILIAFPRTVADGLVAYTVRSQIHIRRLADDRDRVIPLPNNARAPVHAHPSGCPVAEDDPGHRRLGCHPQKGQLSARPVSPHQKPPRCQEMNWMNSP